jgi:hypothetical protein
MLSVSSLSSKGFSPFHHPQALPKADVRDFTCKIIGRQRKQHSQYINGMADRHLVLIGSAFL